MIIWWLFDDYLTDYLIDYLIGYLNNPNNAVLFEIIWCLFNEILAQLFWLFDDYSLSIILIVSWFVLNYSWTFDDYLISTPAASR